MANGTPLQDLADQVHQNSIDHGFWDNPRNFGEAVALMHSELSEALEEDRGSKPVFYLADLPPVPASLAVEFDNGQDAKNAWERQHDGLPRKPEGAAIELVDCAIRVLDWLGHLSATGQLPMTVDELFKVKAEYNAGREKMHGRKY